MKRILAILTLLLLPILFGLGGCENDTSNDLGQPGGTQLTDKTCLGCHSSEDMLKETLGEVASTKVGPALKDDG